MAPQVLLVHGSMLGAWWWESAIDELEH
ncbi:MAG TPA: alpha/beta hydrolase, partial [Arthrobacter bacterium]|nr:alpha/beta hydrolase [Arthrobacter sp.]